MTSPGMTEYAVPLTLTVMAVPAAITSLKNTRLICGADTPAGVTAASVTVIAAPPALSSESAVTVVVPGV